MKKVLSAILTVTILLGCFVFSVSAEETPSITENLVVAYDFEGDDATIRLADKAIAGSVKDDLSISGTVIIDGGVAYVASTKGSELKFMGSEDLRSLTGYTVYVKLKAMGEYGANWTNPIMSNGLFRMIINGKTNGAFTLQARANASHATQHPIPVGLSFKENEWFYAAYTAYIDNGKLKTATYHSNDGITYVQATNNYNFTNAEMGVTNFTVLGAKQDGSIEMAFDDVMFFDRALNANEIKTLSSIKLTDSAEPEDTIPTDTGNEDSTIDTTCASDTEVEVENESGCGSALGFGCAIMVVTAFGIAYCTKKRKND